MSAQVVHLVRPPELRNEGGYATDMRRVWHEDSVLTKGPDVALWKYLYQMAEWRPRHRLSKGRHPREVWLERGEIATSVAFLAKYFEIPVKRVTRILALLEAAKRVERRTPEGREERDSGVVINILNYNEYNPLPESAEDERGMRQGRERGETTKRKKEEGTKEESKQARISCADAHSPAKPAGIAAPSLDLTSPEPSKPTRAETAKAMCDVWNRICGDICPKARGMNDTRERTLLNRLHELGNEPQRWFDFCSQVRASPFLTGQTTDFRAGIDWATKPANILKILEGNYDDHRCQATRRTNGLDRVQERADARATAELRAANGHG